MKAIIGLTLIALLTGCGESQQKEIFNIEDTSDILLYESVKTNYQYECVSKDGEINIDIIEESDYEVKFTAVCTKKD